MREQYKQARTDDRPYKGDSPRDYGNGESERGWWDRASDEVSSWFGDERAEHRREMDDRSAPRGESRESNRGRLPPNEAGLDRTRGRHFERVADIMSHDVVRVHPNDSIQYAARLMGGYDCGSLPVVDRSNRLIGMITDRDIAVRGVAEIRNPARMPVRAVMTGEAFACGVNASLRDCMREMAKHQVRRIPIVDNYDRVVGIVSQADIATHAGKERIPGERRAVADVVCAVSEPTDQPYR